MQVKDFKGGSFVGKEFSEGKMPALFYFSLSAHESLSLAPYNSPVELLQDEPMRIFSFTIPGHEEGLDKFEAMNHWAKNDPKLIWDFIESTCQTIDFLIENEIVDPQKAALAGLSRGGFLAAHIAAKLKKIPTLLGFAPITKLTALTEFSSKPEFETLNLDHQIEGLCLLKNIRFYVGNNDSRVDTDECYQFIRKLGSQKKRNLSVELFITESIGRFGHGTSAETFKEGSLWLKNHIFQ